MYADVLLTTDGSEIATTACRRGLGLASAVGARVHVLFASGVEHAAPWHRSTDDWRTRGDELVDRVATEADEHGLEVESEVRNGPPAREILTYADDANVDLIVCGTHGRTGVRRLVAGSVATTVVREASVPVLTVNRTIEPTDPSIDDVLVATDGRPGVETAIEHALDLAESLGASVRALSIVDDTDTSLPSVLDVFESRAETAVAEVERRAAERGVESTSSVEHGHPSRKIVAVATDADVDLVVMGTESRSGLERVAFGSCSQRVVATAPVPVITVRYVD